MQSFIDQHKAALSAELQSILDNISAHFADKQITISRPDEVTIYRLKENGFTISYGPSEPNMKVTIMWE